MSAGETTLNAFEIIFFGLSAGIATVVGIRLLAIASRSREIPELSVGFVLLMEVISATSWALASTTAVGQLVSTSAAAASVACLTLFVVYTFLPDSRVARVVAAVVLLAAGACVLVPTLNAAWGSKDFYVRFGWGASLARAFSFGWAALVAGRSLAALQRRARLGLSHPLTASRVGFWCLSAAFSSGSFLMPVIEIVTDTVRPGGISPISIGFAIGASSFVWLAFWPPKVYVTWALRRMGHA